MISIPTDSKSQLQANPALQTRPRNIVDFDLDFGREKQSIPPAAHSRVYPLPKPATEGWADQGILIGLVLWVAGVIASCLGELFH